MERSFYLIRCFKVLLPDSDIVWVINVRFFVFLEHVGIDGSDGKKVYLSFLSGLYDDFVSKVNGFL